MQIPSCCCTAKGAPAKHESTIHFSLQYTTGWYLLETSKRSHHVCALNVLVGKGSAGFATHAMNVFTGFVLEEIVGPFGNLEILRSPNTELRFKSRK